MRLMLLKLKTNVIKTHQLVNCNETAEIFLLLLLFFYLLSENEQWKKNNLPEEEEKQQRKKSQQIKTDNWTSK